MQNDKAHKRRVFIEVNLFIGLLGWFEFVDRGFDHKAQCIVKRSSVSRIKKLPPPTPDRCEGRLFPPEQSETTKMSLPMATEESSEFRFVLH
jgi:hypothetical protein